MKRSCRDFRLGVRNSHPIFLRWMLELVVTTFHCPRTNHPPATTQSPLCFASGPPYCPPTVCMVHTKRLHANALYTRYTPSHPLAENTDRQKKPTKKSLILSRRRASLVEKYKGPRGCKRGLRQARRGAAGKGHCTLCKDLNRCAITAASVHITSTPPTEIRPACTYIFNKISVLRGFHNDHRHFFRAHNPVVHGSSPCGPTRHEETAPMRGFLCPILATCPLFRGHILDFPCIGHSGNVPLAHPFYFAITAAFLESLHRFGTGSEPSDRGNVT